MKGGANIEIHDEYLDEFLHNNNLWIELAKQFISNDQSVSSDTVQDSKEFSSKKVQAKKEKQ